VKLLVTKIRGLYAWAHRREHLARENKDQYPLPSIQVDILRVPWIALMGARGIQDPELRQLYFNGAGLDDSGHPIQTSTLKSNSPAFIPLGFFSHIWWLSFHLQRVLTCRKYGNWNVQEAGIRREYSFSTTKFRKTTGEDLKRVSKILAECVRVVYA
jgi:hypothetical protein